MIGVAHYHVIHLEKTVGCYACTLLTTRRGPRLKFYHHDYHHAEAFVSCLKFYTLQLKKTHVRTHYNLSR